MIRRPPRSTHCISSAASDVYKRQGDEGGVRRGNVVLAEERARGAGPAGYVERGFYGERNSFERAKSFSAHDAGLGVARAGAGGFGVNVNEGIELGLNLFYAVEVRRDELNGRDLFAAEFLESFSDGGINWLGHGGQRKGNGLTRIGQGELEKSAESRYKIG